MLVYFKKCAPSNPHEGLLGIMLTAFWIRLRLKAATDCCRRDVSTFSVRLSEEFV